ncbi:hypothetical protein PSEUDO8Z_100058 [Pseudomonas sp. 8Z]|nr:hypothetical protein PSEUDO8Z_100058 [Pseudomonas sp. 8Z]
MLLRHCVSPYLLLNYPLPVLTSRWLCSGDLGNQLGLWLLPVFGQVLYGGLQEGLASHIECAKGNYGAEHACDYRSSIAAFTWSAG